MAVVWIVDNKKTQRQRARRVVAEILPKAQVVEWDGALATLPTDQPAADFVILDLNLGPARSGLDAVKEIPGAGLHAGGPFIIIWSHFEGDYPLSDFFQQYPSDRIVRTRWKANAKLAKHLQAFAQRFREEGVYLAYNNK
jgi:hypothetical protein